MSGTEKSEIELISRFYNFLSLLSFSLQENIKTFLWDLIFWFSACKRSAIVTSNLPPVHVTKLLQGFQVKSCGCKISPEISSTGKMKKNYVDPSRVCQPITSVTCDNIYYPGNKKCYWHSFGNKLRLHLSEKVKALNFECVNLQLLKYSIQFRARLAHKIFLTKIIICTTWL